MFRQKNGQIGIMAVTLAVVFTVGLILGTVALFYVPKDVVKEATEAFVLNENTPFWELFQKNITFELMWLLILWLLGSSNVTAPFVAAIMSLRGFVIGFSVSFVLVGELDRVKLFLCSILPQCVTALPVMSVFIITCVLHASDKKYGGSYQTGYFLRGIVFLLVTVVASVGETWLMILFEKIC